VFLVPVTNRSIEERQLPPRRWTRLPVRRIGSARLGVDLRNLLAGTNTFTGVNTFNSKITGQVITVANNASASIDIFGGSNQGLLFISDSAESTSAMVWLHGPYNTTNISADPLGVYSVISGTASKINVYYSAGYKIENKRGSTTNYTLVFIGV